MAPKYTTLSGSPLPLFHARGRLSYGSYGRTARLSRSQLKARNRCLLCTPIALSVVLTLMLFRSMSDSRDAKKLLLPDDLGAAAERAAPVMSRADALAAMYAPASLSSHRARAASSERCAQRYTLMLVADSDAASRDADADGGGRWHSSLKRGTLCRRYERAAAHSEGEGVTFSVDWEDEVALHSRLNSGERGMELSELIWFEGRLLACDDRTGIVYHISAGVAHPRLILSEEADESAAPSLKCEWMSVRRGSLYVGGVGHEYRDATGHLRSTNQLVKVFEPHGNAPRELNWTDTYGALERAAVGSRGYLIHEAVLWDERAVCIHTHASHFPDVHAHTPFLPYVSQLVFPIFLSPHVSLYLPSLNSSLTPTRSSHALTSHSSNLRFFQPPICLTCHFSNPVP